MDIYTSHRWGLEVPRHDQPEVCTLVRHHSSISNEVERSRYSSQRAINQKYVGTFVRHHHSNKVECSRYGSLHLFCCCCCCCCSMFEVLHDSYHHHYPRRRPRLWLFFRVGVGGSCLLLFDIVFFLVAGANPLRQPSCSFLFVCLFIRCGGKVKRKKQ
jgi:hypothetical protein